MLKVGRYELNDYYRAIRHLFKTRRALIESIKQSSSVCHTVYLYQHAVYSLQNTGGIQTSTAKNKRFFDESQPTELMEEEETI